MTTSRGLWMLMAGVVVLLLASMTVVSASGAYFSTDTSTETNSWETAARFPNWTALSVGRDHACATDRMGDVWCWGNSNEGANGTSSEQPSPTKVEGFPTGTKLVDVGVGHYHSCALSDEGRAWCWGANWNGQLGNSSTTNTSTPQAVSTATGMGEALSGITGGGRHTCALDVTGQAWCWGQNGRGQVGAGTEEGTAPAEYTTPVAVADLGATVSEISAGEEHTCARSTSGGSAHPRAWCWGEQELGRLGNGADTEEAVRSPQLVSTDASRMPGAIVSLTAGRQHTCAAEDDGTAWCWGSGDNGRLGDDGTTSRALPTKVESTRSFAMVRAGYANSCAYEDDGTPWCWGRASEGEIGDGPATTSPQPPADATDRLTATAVTTTSMTEPVSDLGSGHWLTCGLASGDLWCWGKNDHGRLGVGTLNEIYDNPQRIPD